MCVFGYLFGKVFTFDYFHYLLLLFNQCFHLILIKSIRMKNSSLNNKATRHWMMTFIFGLLWHRNPLWFIPLMFLKNRSGIWIQANAMNPSKLRRSWLERSKVLENAVNRLDWNGWKFIVLQYIGTDECIMCGYHNGREYHNNKLLTIIYSFYDFQLQIIIIHTFITNHKDSKEW